ncbi:cation diffusion facilitator family transporter [Massilia glaciei]|uniref:Cation diffusion facilitator family transporter n=1 Tax=Massilia glaciei TaxID=1524097 RepID=A0A2U2I629_9BURK|nr:cation diffusion facilitator family transporter [Massilia glaciei]PWF55105.1 cation diffusion facilitator family transporter [Massilia glaciei]
MTRPEHAQHQHEQHEHASHEQASDAHANHAHGGHEHDAHDHDGHACAHDHHAKPAAPGADHGHQHGHGHSHGHGHHHALDPNGNMRAFALAIGLNSVFVLIEFFYGWLANSTALMADAGHNLSDVLGLVLAWGAAMLARTAPSGRYTYGLRSSSILAALLNALLLMMACGAIGWEAVHRLSQPAPVAGLTVSIVAAIGVVINGFSAWLFMRGSKDDINIRGAYQHMAADALISLGVVVSGLAIMATGWAWIDPALSIVIVLLILVSTWSLLRESLRMVLAAVPDNVDLPAVEQFLRELPGVSEVHDLHIWAMSTTEAALTAHLVMPAGYPGDGTIDAIVARLRNDFAIHHSTLQVEQGTTAHGCALHGEAAH